MNKTEEVYELEFDQLVQRETGVLTTNNNLFDAEVSVSVSIGSVTKSIRDILGLHKGSTIVLDKHIDEKLDIYLNDKKIACGESVVFDNNISVKVLDVQNSRFN
ncbi:FliM/FliN family flagellar motor switch protein [Metaclostridioides mangenotii]|uniref:FliM/FliN family flagellar motor switch protein n=1 Tax=Metaclostridioides mangenotii TaxID=1540 RepID=UPI000485953A|nr:FliM/FliN family flagellar motor switch protein [Clostridioides mangenotii]